MQWYRPASRSIPAHAGEPQQPTRASSSTRVDPRARGGAALWRRGRAQRRGRSPRTRGSPTYRRCAADQLGSIPAHAGEPPLQVWIRPYCRVDPRARGGALRKSFQSFASWGRSPRTRGSPAWARRCSWDGGSIPAHAGEPLPHHLHASTLKVDPRARGGAPCRGGIITMSRGRSPRTRGSPYSISPVAGYSRSIPAHAGEPWRSPAAP